MSFFNRVIRKLRRQRRETEFSADLLDISQREALIKAVDIAAGLEHNIKLIQEAFGYSQDLELRRFKAGPEQVPGALFYLDGMVSHTDVSELLRNVEIDLLVTKAEPAGRKEIFDTVRQRLLAVGDLKEAGSLEEVLRGISRGETALFFDGTPRVILCDTRGWAVRNVVEPDAEIAIRGPRDGFVENLRTNTSLLRRRLHTPNLWVENMVIGSLTRTQVGIAYIKGLADEKVVGEVRSRLGRIHIDGILESGYLEEYLCDQPYTLFPLVFRTERPDRVCAALLEGRVAIITDGTPVVLVVPAQFAMMIQAVDDYYELFPIGTFLRGLRYAAFLVSIFLPGVYVAVINFHQELLPAVLFLRIAASREGVPFPVVAEAFLMEGLFEMLREAGVRLPRAIGPAISIVGALVLGDAAIRAGIVSPAMVIIVALTAIASFTVPIFGLGIAARMVRFIFILLGGIFGLFGIQLGLLMLLLHLCSLRSFGLPYMSPFGPFVFSDMKDNILRVFWWLQTRRPFLVGHREPVRQGRHPKPGRRRGPEEGEG